MRKVLCIIFITFSINIPIACAQLYIHGQHLQKIQKYIFFMAWTASAIITAEGQQQQAQTDTYVKDKKVRYYLFFPSLFPFNSETSDGIENLFTLHSAWSAIDNRLIPKSLSFLKNNNALAKTMNIFYRATKLFLIDYPINFVLPTLIHEFFGHGIRYYQNRFGIGWVYIPLPPPFMFESPYIKARYNWNYKNESYNQTITTQQEDLLATIGGSEASTIMANTVRRNVLISGSFDYRSSFLYLYSNNDLNGYAAFVSGIGDIQDYKAGINRLYKHHKKKIDDTKLLAYGLIGILGDPLNYYSFYNIFKNYLFDGNTKWRIPWIPLSFTVPVTYLPKVRFGLTPYGVEFFVNNYVKHENTVYALIIGFTDGTFDSSWRIQTKIWNIFIHKNMSIDINAQLWQQPPITFFVNNALETSQGLGGAFFITYNHDKLINDFIGIVLQVGYKSAGFLEGHALQSSFIARFAFSVSFSS